MRYFILSIFLLSIGDSAMAQRCEVISMQHFGGEWTDKIDAPGVVTYPNGSFSFTVTSSSTTGSINTSCLQTLPNGGVAGSVLLTYDDEATLLGQYCAPKVLEFQMLSTFNFYPQPNGDTVLIGMRNTSSGHDIGIQRRDAAGNVLFTKFYGGSRDDGLGSILPMPDGGYTIVTGTNSDDGDVGLHYGSVFDADIWILRLDSAGNKLWGKVLGGSQWDLISAIQPGPDGSVYLFGMTESNDHEAVGMKGVADLYIVKLDSAGNKLWHKCLGGTGWDGCGGVPGVFAMPDNAGGFYVLNHTASQDGDVQHRMPIGTDFWLLHIDSAANILWERTFGGGNGQIPAAFCRGADGSFWMGGIGTGYDGPGIGGMIDQMFGGTDIWIVHADSMGNFINQRTLGNDNHEYLRALHPLPDGSVLAAGLYGKGISESASPLFPLNSEGSIDVFIAQLGPGTTTVDEVGLQKIQWDLYPNPAKEEVIIDMENISGKPYSLLVTQANGKTRYKSQLKNKLKIDVSKWSSGMYFFTLMSKDGVKSTREVSVTH